MSTKDRESQTGEKFYYRPAILPEVFELVRGWLLFFTSAFAWFCVTLMIFQGSNSRSDLVSGVVFAVVLSILTAAQFHRFPNITCTDEGLSIRVFIFWRKEIPWSDVLQIVPGTPGRWLILVRRLTPIHHVVATLDNTWGRKPGFWIAQEMVDSARLIDLIQAHIEGNE